MNRETIALFGATIVLVAVLAVPGCNQPFGPIVGGPCAYDDTPGIATIVSVTDADPNNYNCANDPVEVVFDFVPDDAVGVDRVATGLRIIVSDGANPPRSWVEDEGLTEGSEHPCVRRDIVSGTCTPVLYEFTEADYDAGTAACW